jgi:hypothetical protein
MGNVECPCPVKLIAGVISSSETASRQAEESLAEAFGVIDYKSKMIDFDFTSYYTEEMGTGLKRYFLGFKKLIDPANLANIKIFTNEAERLISAKTASFKRAVNIDPGYITAAKLVLASTKDYSHRIYLCDGIYAETTLSYRKDTFRPLDWTYPDYRTDDYIGIFNDMRDIFMRRGRT